VNPGLVILGGGVTGLAAGYASGSPVYEATSRPGGICASYSIDARGRRSEGNCRELDSYRFELGGGHWIWGGDPVVLRLMASQSALKCYERRARVYFPDRDLLVPYPLQANLRSLGDSTALSALRDLIAASRGDHEIRTRGDSLRGNFGETLYQLFFEPFHDLYTAGLADEIAPQDAAKSPVNLWSAVRGAMADGPSDGYNAKFWYPADSSRPSQAGSHANAESPTRKLSCM
jgi:protoporphyrinogen oxidase